MNDNISPFFNTAYIHWLSRQVKSDDYRNLMQSLAAIPFRSGVLMDRNRSIDAEELRILYQDETGRRLYAHLHGCSVLEFLVALANRVNESFDSIRTDMAFFMFIRNMKLDRCNDDWFLDQKDPECYIQDRCDIMMDRQYEPNGSNGGLFIVDGKRDIRPSEWWWQMQYWLNQQYIPDM